jgi:uncharacterized protein (TIGR03435 family)
MARLAAMLSAQLQRPVDDKTEVTGVFDFTLTWTPDDAPPGQQAAVGGGESIQDRRDGPSVFAALQEQLGLKLETRKVPTQMLIVDHAEKTPIEN